MTNPSLLSSNGARAIALIENEHRALARMLGAMQALVARYRDPGAELTEDYRRLYQRIVELTPTPLKSYLEGAAPGSGT